MGGVIDAELMPTGDGKGGTFIQRGLIDMGKDSTFNSVFRDIWVVIFYLGLMMPYAFIGFWIGKIANNEFLLPIGQIAFAIMLLKVPFFLRIVWAQPVEKWTSLPMGRRRSWILIGTGLHILLVIPMMFIDIQTSFVLFISVMFIALIPRLVAEQAVAGMMAESIPKLGRFNSGINFAYRGGGHILLLLMGWALTFSSSPFSKAGELVNADALQRAGVILTIVTALFAVAITMIMREGKAVRGPRKQAKWRAAKTMQEAIENPELAFPAKATVGSKILAVMRTKTAWIVLALCFLMPLGDGFEGMFLFYQRDVLGFNAGEAVRWANIFIFATYLGLFGPFISDYIGRGKVLRMAALGSIACYAGLAVLMLVGAPEIAILILWLPTLTITDWLIFTFITTWAEVSDPRLGPTHMAMYQTTQAVAATFVWYGLAVLLIYATGGMYWLIFALACIGPLIGLTQFKKLRLGDEYGSDPIDLRASIKSIQARLAALPWGSEAVDFPSRMKLARATAMAGLLLSGLLFGAPFMLLNWKSVDHQESWSAEWNETVIFVEGAASLTNGEAYDISVEVPGAEGGLFLVNWSLIYEGDSGALGGGLVDENTWHGELSLPDAMNLTEPGYNNSDWIGEDNTEALNWTATTETFGPPLVNLSGMDEMLEQIEEVKASRAGVNWGYGVGTYLLRVRVTEAPPFSTDTRSSFQLQLAVSHFRAPFVSEDSDEMIIIITSNEENHAYGTAIGVLLGFPMLIATPVLSWVARQDPEEIPTLALSE